ncbi:MBL fold metallo-hydrolase [Streptomyces sp. NPDC051677]|uniref:MBL fold metallo-hydrolase n=1 Tax=Streptomyces sp. NPDC051677 TaxID=3365669 RepID=UPI0037D04959
MPQNPLSLQVYTSSTREFGRHGESFSPTTATLITGRSEAVLVDTQFIRSEVVNLGDMIERSGRRLTTIYITHPHADHFLGLRELLTRFPEARPVAAPSVCAAFEKEHGEQIKQWRGWFGDDVDDQAPMPFPTDGDTLHLEGHELRIVEVGQGDIAPTAVLHIPSLNAVIAGDVAYNHVHPMLAFGGPAEWQGWIDSLEQLMALGANTVVAGHKHPQAPDQPGSAILNMTRAYIEDFRTAVRSSSRPKEVIEAMTGMYPDHANLFTLIVSATAAFNRT